MNVLERIRVPFAAAAPGGVDPAAFAAAVRPSTDPKFGEYQANGCMAAAKAAGQNPRAMAADVAARVDLLPMADTPEVAGPGFLNVRLREDWLASSLDALLGDDRMGLEPPSKSLTVVIDYSSPNVAKPMHVGHIRSMVIGEALARIFSALGHKVIRDNHLGDWGAQVGMILWGYKHALIHPAYDADPVKELARLYRLAQSEIKAGKELAKAHAPVFKLLAEGRRADAEALFTNTYDGSGLPLEVVEKVVGQGREVAEVAREEVAKLHAGDPENRRLWAEFMPACLAALKVIYDRLDVHHDVHLGESFYDPMLAGIIDDLEAKGLAVPSEGATVVHIPGKKAPMLVRKSNGAYNYGTTDLATVKHRVDTWQPDLILNVVDSRQAEHFSQVFDVSRRWGYPVRQEHVAFGTILGNDRKPFKTRDGDTVELEPLLDDAVAAAREVVDASSPELDQAERAAIAEVVGIGAIKYADLSQNRLSDYVFDMRKMVAMTGNTATYLQYAYARIQNIFRKGEVDPAALRVARPPILLTHPLERSLGVQVLRLPETLELAAAELKPNILADYLFELANKYSAFYADCPVLKAESPERRDSRLALCDLAGRALKLGLDLLGIGVVERM